MNKIKEGWKKVKLGEICEFKYGKGLPKRERSEGYFPVYGSGGIVDYHRDYYVTGQGIVIGRKGTIGSVFFENRNFYPIDTVFYIEEKKDTYDIRFLYFMLLTLNLDKLNSDAAVPGLNRNTAYQQETFLPPLPTQHKIAAILSAYDELIEYNTAA
ncbi:MAG: restriction endonuclease subunit S [Thermodesulfobacteriota bacterium]